MIDDPNAEQLEEFDHEGFTVTAYVVPDWDARPGEDDVTPVVEEIDWPQYYAEQEERDEAGHYVRRGVVGTDGNGHPCRVSVEELDRLERAGWGGHSYSQRRVRRLLREEAAAWIAGDRYYVGIVVEACLAGMRAEASLWGIDCDVRDREQTHRYQGEVARELAGEAVDEAASRLLGGLAPLALSY